MKAFFLAGTILFTVLILILAFENMALSCTGFLFVFIPLGNPFVMVLATAGIGVFAGIFYAALIMSALRTKQEDEEDPGGVW